MMELVVATRNRGKVEELNRLLAPQGFAVRSLGDFPEIEEPEENGADFAANARIKAAYYQQHTGLACLADDSGLEVDCLQGAPGVYSARFAGPTADDQANNAKLLQLLQEVPEEARTARFRCVIALYRGGDDWLLAEGACEGRILREPRGTGGFGYDPLFYSPAHGKTLAEMTLEEKNAVSHRGQALRRLVEQLAGRQP